MKVLKEILQLPLVQRCQELAVYFNLPSVKDLHDGFPLLISSIFYGEGGPGWGIRFITYGTQPVEYETLYNFFDPVTGPLFRLLYRLTAESFKYNVSCSDLSGKHQRIVKGATFSSFYNNMVYVDSFQNQIIGLRMSPFDFFLFHFAHHGTISYYRLLSAGSSRAPVHDRVQSLYVGLSSLYFCTFLPTDTQYIDLPQNVEMLVKTMPNGAPAKSPTKTIRYLLPDRLNLQVPSDPSEALQSQSARIVHWRSRSILHIFIDVWLCMDVEAPFALPTIELIRSVRTLVKVLHAFSNFSDPRDSAAFVKLRKEAREKLGSRFFDFFDATFDRWPLYDGSMLDILELWLSYIQPWRYQTNNDVTPGPIIDRKFEIFIARNLTVYTQTFGKLMRRLMDIDLTRELNANLLYRPCRVFTQRNLLDLLRQQESEILAMKINECTPPWLAAYRGFNEPQMGTFEYANGQFYVPLFRNKTVCYVPDVMTYVVRNLLRKVRGAIAVAETNREEMERFNPWLAMIFGRNLHTGELREIKEALARLEYVQDILIIMFDLPNSADNSFAEENVAHDASESMESSVSSLLQKNWIDTALLPIKNNENTFLVRFLHTVCSKLQLMFDAEIQAIWDNDNLLGHIGRQILLPPCTIQRFERQIDGSKQLTTEHLPARICLRFLASYQVLALILCSFLLGYIFLGAPSYGFFTLIILTVCYKILEFTLRT